MKRYLVGPLALGALIVCVVAASSQPPGRDKGDRKEGPRDRPPPRFQLGNVFPPHLKEELKLTKEQEKQLADLEKEVKAKLEKILTKEQQKKIEDFRPPRPDGPPPGPPPGDRRERKERPEKE